MNLARVVGTAVTTKKHASLAKQKLLIVQPLMADGTSLDGDPLLAIDSVGAGRGDTVLITSDGSLAREILKVDATPVRWTSIGIRDER